MMSINIGERGWEATRGGLQRAPRLENLWRRTAAPSPGTGARALRRALPEIAATLHPCCPLPCRFDHGIGRSLLTILSVVAIDFLAVAAGRPGGGRRRARRTKLGAGLRLSGPVTALKLAQDVTGTARRSLPVCRPAPGCPA